MRKEFGYFLTKRLKLEHTSQKYISLSKLNFGFNLESIYTSLQRDNEFATKFIPEVPDLDYQQRFSMLDLTNLRIEIFRAMLRRPLSCILKYY